MRNDETTFYAQRDRFNQLIREGISDGMEAASLFYYLNRTCYNGLCRFNSKGEFNVPFGRYKKIIYKTDFSEYVPAFAQWEFACADFEKVPLELMISSMQTRPMMLSLRNTEEPFGWYDQVRLAEL